MNPFCILVAEWRRSRAGVLALVLLIGLSVSLGLALSMVERGIRQGAAQAGDDFDLLIGAPGSPTQLLLSAVYLKAQALPLLDYNTCTQLIADPAVAWAAPLAFGDRWKDAPMVGTSSTLVTLGGTRALSDGVVFAEHDEAVVGALIPLALGETFVPLHGRVSIPDGDHAHEQARFTVVGRLPLTGTPWDKAILVPVAAVWEAHGLQAGQPGAALSAVVVKPRTIADAYRLRAQWQKPATQAVFTGEVLTELFATLGDMRTIMQSLSAVSQGIALGGVILATLFAVALRRDTLSLLRTLGAPKRYLMLAVWSLSGGIIVFGTLCGVVFSIAEAHVVAALVRHATTTVLPISLSATEWFMAGGFAAVGFLAAAVPALSLYRTQNRG